MTQKDDITAIARAGYEAYVAKDRAALERLIAEDVHFTSGSDGIASQRFRREQEP
jgi:ketosteroid isomerase-like protein